MNKYIYLFFCLITNAVFGMRDPKENHNLPDAINQPIKYKYKIRLLEHIEKQDNDTSFIHNKSIRFNDPKTRILDVKCHLLRENLMSIHDELYITYLPDQESREYIPFKKLSNKTYIIGLIDKYKQPYLATCIPQEFNIKITEYRK